MNNFEKIKNMNINEMAKWFAKYVCNCEHCSFNCSSCDDCEKLNKQWLMEEAK